MGEIRWMIETADGRMFIYSAHTREQALSKHAESPMARKNKEQIVTVCKPVTEK